LQEHTESNDSDILQQVDDACTGGDRELRTPLDGALH
jgi:hypothetical protein